LFLNDCRDFPVDEDTVGCNVDLALGVTKSNHLLVAGGLDGLLRSRGQAVELTGADLAGAAAGEDLQQDHPHRLWVVETRGVNLCSVAAGDEHLLVAGKAEERQCTGDLREGVVVDVVPVVQGRRAGNAGDLPKPAGHVCLGDPLPG